MIDSLNKISQNSKPPSDQSASSNLGCLNEPLEVPIKFSKKTKSGKKIRIVAVADTHSSHRQIPIVPDGDIFICCGDFTHKNDWRKEEMPVSVKDFNLWLGDLPHKHKIVIAGNHEIGFNKLTKEEIQKQILTHCVYLQDSELLLEGIRFYGTPWTTSKNMAFSCPRELIGKKWEVIPSGLDILITHLPPKDTFDLTPTGHWGNSDLRKQVLERIKPKIHLFGHVHEEGQRWTKIDGVNFINAAVSIGRRPPPLRCPVYFDYFVESKRKELKTK